MLRFPVRLIPAETLDRKDEKSATEQFGEMYTTTRENSGVQIHVNPCPSPLLSTLILLLTLMAVSLLGSECQDELFCIAHLLRSEATIISACRSAAEALNTSIPYGIC